MIKEGSVCNVASKNNWRSTKQVWSSSIRYFLGNLGLENLCYQKRAKNEERSWNFGVKTSNKRRININGRGSTWRNSYRFQNIPHDQRKCNKIQVSAFWNWGSRQPFVRRPLWRLIGLYRKEKKSFWGKAQNNSIINFKEGSVGIASPLVSEKRRKRPKEGCW